MPCLGLLRSNGSWSKSRSQNSKRIMELLSTILSTCSTQLNLDVFTRQSTDRQFSCRIIFFIVFKCFSCFFPNFSPIGGGFSLWSWVRKSMQKINGHLRDDAERTQRRCDGSRPLRPASCVSSRSESITNVTKMRIHSLECLLFVSEYRPATYRVLPKDAYNILGQLLIVARPVLLPTYWII